VLLGTGAGGGGDTVARALAAPLSEHWGRQVVVDNRVGGGGIIALEMLAQASTTIECECPKHLVELIRSLASFETYSEQCSARSDLDAALHQDLQQQHILF
jgi:hypothetical protein